MQLHCSNLLYDHIEARVFIIFDPAFKWAINLDPGVIYYYHVESLVEQGRQSSTHICTYLWNW